MNDRGEGCYPSTKQQSHDTGLSERAVCQHLQIAEDNGFLNKQRHGFGGRGWNRQEYIACYPQGTDAGSAPETNNALTESKCVIKKGTDAGSVRNSKKALTQDQHHNNRGTDFDDIKALTLTTEGTDAGSARIYNSPKNSPLNTHIDDYYSASTSVDKKSIQDIFKWLENHFNAPNIFYITAPIEAWLLWGADFEKDIKPVANAYKTKNPNNPPQSFTYLNDRIAASIRQRNEPMPDISSKEDRKPSKKPLSPVMYFGIKKKIADGYSFVSDQEREFIRAFEAQELGKVSP